MIPAALLLDLDGTLVDSEPVYVEAYRRILPTCGIHPSEEELQATIGVADEETMPAMIRHHNASIALVELIRRKENCFSELVASGALRLRGGTHAMLGQARSLGIACLVVSSSPRSMVELCLEATGLAAWLPMRICGGDVVRRKPDAEPYRLAAQRLAVPPRRCLAVEDSLSGVAAARAAGCQVVAVEGSFPRRRLAEAGASRTIAVFDELFPFDLPESDGR